MQRAKEQAMAEFSARAGPAKSVPPDTLQLRVESENYQPPVDAEGDQVTGTIGATASVVAWDNQSLNNLVQKIVLAKYGPQYDLPMSQLRLPPPEVQEAQNQHMRVKVRADAIVVQTVDPGEIAGRLRGKSSAEAQSILESLPGVAGSPRIELSPPWAPWAYRVEVGVSAPK